MIPGTIKCVVSGVTAKDIFLDGSFSSRKLWSRLDEIDAGIYNLGLLKV